MKVSGPDAAKFLQGQLTCDIHSLQLNTPKFCALCNNKGRVIASFRLWKEREKDDFFILQLPPEMIDLVIKTLQKYAQFSNVKLEKSEEKLPSINELDDIRAGIANINLKTTGLFTPHDLNYPAIGAISFNKGCYTGQEIIARMEYRGKLKKKLQYKKLTSLDNIDGELVSFVKIDEHHYEALIIA